MHLRKVAVRQLLRLYPASWRNEYGVEMRAMLLEQPLTPAVAGDVLRNALRENFRHPDPWKITALFLICWRCFWILLPAAFQFSPAAWVRFSQLDHGVFLLASFCTGCWTVINEGDVFRGSQTGWWSTITGLLTPYGILVIIMDPLKTIPGWVFVALNNFSWEGDAERFGSFFVHVILSAMLPSLCGALLGNMVRTRFRKPTDRRSA